MKSPGISAQQSLSRSNRCFSLFTCREHIALIIGRSPRINPAMPPIVLPTMDVSLSYATQLKGLLAKSDGKDKFVALLQYAAMFASAGEPGRCLSAQKSLSAARKPFRVFKPIEFLMPLVERPPKGKGVGACVQYVRDLRVWVVTLTTPI